MSENRTTLAATSSERDARFDIAIVDQSQDATDAARDAAEARLTDELNADGGKIRRWVRSIWKGNYAKEVYRQRYILEAAKTINESQDQFAHVAADSTQKANAQMATIERMLQGPDETIHEEAGESREVLDDDSDIAVAAKELVRRYAAGNLDEDALQEEQGRILEAYRTTHTDDKDALRRCAVQVNNITQVARAVKGAVEQGESLDRIVQDMRVVDGTERSGARTEHVQTATDRLIERMGKHEAGRLAFMTPEVTVGAIAIATSAIRVGATIGVGNALRVVAPGVAGGVIAGMRESRQVRKERMQHSREMAQGSEMGSGDKRRQEMDETRYETRSAADEAASIRESLGLEDFENNDIAAVHDVMMQVAELQARRRISDTDKKDLFSFTSAVSMGAERHDLDMAIVEAKIALARKFAVDGVHSGLQDRFGASPAEILAAAQEAHGDLIEQDATEKNKAFNKLRSRRVAEKVTVGLAAGLTFGVMSQEVVAAVQPSLGGLMDNMTGQDTALHDGKLHETLLKRVFDSDGSGNSPESHEVAFGDSKFDVSGGSAAVENNTLTIDAGGHTIDVPVEADGQLSDDVRAQLEEHGIRVGESQEVPVETTVTKQVGMSANEFVEHYSDKTTHVVRDFWYDNDTPAPVFDLNEQGLHWGGEHGNGVGSNGEVQLSIATMTEDGSFTNGNSVAWQEAAASGNLKIAISATENTQTQPFILGIKPDGSIDIPQDHPAAQLFSMVDGHMQFNGAYGEVVQTNGVDVNGAEHIRPLATMVGTKEWDGGLVDVVTKETKISYITSIEVPNETVTELPPIVPVPLPRKSMESIRRNTHSPYSYYSYDNYYMSRAEMEQFQREISPTLRDNPDADLVPSQEIAWFADNLRSTRGSDYVDGMVDQIISSPDIARVDDSKDIIVTIPVGAVTEADNIYKTLSLYAKQENSAVEGAVLLLNVNWTDAAVADGKQSEIDRTKAEIERARQDFPELTIVTVEQEYRQTDIDRTGGIPGYMANDLTNAALLTIHERIRSGSIAPDHEIAILRHDADAQGMSARLLQRFRDVSVANMAKGVDVFKGSTRFDTHRHEPYPGFGAVSNFSAALAVASVGEGRIHTGGANFAVRAATLAAVGGLGNVQDQTYTGPGSDDLMIGSRIANGRRGYGHGAAARQGYGYSNAGVSDKSRIKFVAGATVDTDAQRLIPPYLLGRSFQEAWSPESYSGTSGYSLRDAEAKVLADKPAENFSANETFTAIEHNMSHELSYNSAAASRRALSAFFGTVPGAYYIEGDLGSPDVKLHLTRQGKKYLKSRIGMDERKKTSKYGASAVHRLYSRRRDGRTQLVQPT